MNDALASSSNPYPGLRPFKADETHLFFGRDEQRTQLLSRLRQARFLAVVGTSGCGKSSLVRAGLLPGLYGGFMAGSGSRWRIVDTRPGGDPIGRLAAALDAKGALHDEDQEYSFTKATLRRSSLGLVHMVKEAHLSESQRVLVLVDQFEELFRFIESAHASEAIDDASAFVQLLLEAARQPDVPIYVVITMRSDFLGDCARFRDLPEAINEGQYLIPRLTRDQRREAITGPASVCGASLSPALVNRLLNDVGDVPDQLPILQHALMRTWNHWKDENPDSDTIDLDDYEEIGGMAKALSIHADAVFEGLADRNDPEEGQARMHIAEMMFKCLTEEGEGGRKVRRLARLQEIADVADAGVDEVASIIEAFRQPASSFLMPPIGEELEPDSYIDISHESLIRNWKTLNQWVDEEAASADVYKRLARKAELHRQKQEDLLGGQALGVVRNWKARQQPTAAWAERYDRSYETAMKYLAASEAKVRAEDDARFRSLRIRKTWLAGLAITLLTPAFMFLSEGYHDAELNRIEEAKALPSYLMSTGKADEHLARFYEIRFYEPASFGKERQDVELLKLYGADDHAQVVDAFYRNSILSLLESYETARALLGVIFETELGSERLIETFLRKKTREVARVARYMSRHPELPAELRQSYNELYGELSRGSATLTGTDMLEKLFHDLMSSSEPRATHYLLENLIETYESEGRSAAELFYELDSKMDFGKFALGDLHKQDRLLINIYKCLDLMGDKCPTPTEKELEQLYELDERERRLEIKSRLTDTDAPSDVVPDSSPEAPEADTPLFANRQAPGTSNANELHGTIDTDTRLFAKLLEHRGTKHWDIATKAISNFKSGNEQKRLIQILDGPAPTAEDGKVLRRLLKGEFVGNYWLRSIERNRGGGDADNHEGNPDEQQLLTALSPTDLRKAFWEPRTLDERRRISFVWVTRELLERNAAQKKIRNAAIARFFKNPEDWQGSFGFISNHPTFEKTIEAIKEFYFLIATVLLWFFWLGWRRYRARQGKLGMARAGLVRIGLASLCDILLGVLLGIFLGLFIGAVTYLPLAIAIRGAGPGSAANFMGLTASVMVPIVLVLYLLFRDALKFRFHRSIGKILFELRPIPMNGGPITKKLSAKRNWVLLAGGIVLLPVILTVSFTLLFENLIVAAFVGLTLLLLSLAMLEKLGDRIAHMKVIDSRSDEAAAVDPTGDAVWAGA